MTHSNVYEALFALGFEGVYSPLLGPSATKMAEGALHEFAHWVTMRRRGYVKEDEKSFPSRNHGLVSQRLKDLPPHDSDWNELETLAVEIKALKKLGIPAKVGFMVDAALDEMRSAYFKRLKRGERLVRKLMGQKRIARMAARMVREVEAKAAEIAA